MATELARIAPINNPARLESLPAWLQLQTDALAREAYPDTPGKTLPVLPANLIPNSSERAMIERHIATLQRVLGLGEKIVLREQTLTNSQALGVLIAGLLIKGSGAKLDKASSDALTEDYLDALEDVPAWAIREALRKWNRGESRPTGSKAHDFGWRPMPPTLRALALAELVPIRLRIMQLEQVLEASPRIEFSEEHCARMRERLGGILSPPTTDQREAAE